MPADLGAGDGESGDATKMVPLTCIRLGGCNFKSQSAGSPKQEVKAEGLISSRMAMCSYMALSATLLRWIFQCC